MRPLKPASPESISAVLAMAVSNSPEQRYVLRLCCVLLVGRGRGCDEVAQWFNISARSVQRWASAYAAAGSQGLTEHPAGGRHALLSPDLLHDLDDELSLSPSVFGYPQVCWTGALVVRHIGERFGACLSLRHCQRLLHDHEQRIAAARTNSSGRATAGLARADATRETTLEPPTQQTLARAADPTSTGVNFLDSQIIV